MDRQEEVKTKLDTVRSWLEAAELETVVLTSQVNFAWLTGGGSNHVGIGDAAGRSSLVITPDRVYLLSSNIEVRRVMEEEVAGLPFEAVSWKWYRSDEAKGNVARLCDVSKAVSDLGSWGLPLASDGLTELRYTMLPPEIERYRSLGVGAAQAIEITCTNARQGETELDVAASLAFECQKQGILPLMLLVAGDERVVRYRHPLPTRNQIGRTLLVALTGRRHGLHVSLTQMVSYGTPSVDLAMRHRAVVAVDARLNLESRGGASLGEVMHKGIDQYSSEGFPEEWELHHQGASRATPAENSSQLLSLNTASHIIRW